MKLISAKPKKAAVLIITLIVVVALLVYAAAFISISINQNLVADSFKRSLSAFNFAEAGLDHGLAWLRAWMESYGTPPIGDYTNPWGSVQSLGNSTFGYGTYSVTINDLGVIGGSKRYKVTSRGTFGNHVRTLTNYVQVDNFARYLWFTDTESYKNSTVWFSSGDTLDGPTRTNTHFNISGNPSFSEDVSSVETYLNFYNNGNNIHSQEFSTDYDHPTFSKGVDFGVDKIDYSSVATASTLKKAAGSSGGLYLNGSTTVILKNNGTMAVTNSRKGWYNRSMSLPANGALFVNNGTLTVAGTLNGQLTVGATGNVVIPNNLVYADKTSTSNDILGIISESNIMVDSSAPYDLEIDACILALNTSFYVENWSSGSAKGTLTVLGGIIQEQRGPVGTFSSTTGRKVTGYSKNYSYDTRLLSSPPPFMPTTGDYLTLSWEED